MKICFVNSTSKWGGVKSWTLDVACGLSARGHNVLIVGRPGPFIEKAATMGLETLGVSFGPDFNPVRIAGFLRLFRSRGTDLVVVNVGKDMRTAGVAAKMLRLPVVHRVGLAGDMLNTYKVRLLHRWIRPAILVPCAQIKAGLLHKLPYLHPDEITVIRTGKDPALFMPDAPHTPLRLVSSSQLNKDKGHSDILHALVQLQRKGITPEYHIVGTGKYETELKALAVRLGVASQVRWLGFQRDVRACLRQCDLFLLPSYVEGLPNSLLEAMAEGLACVARNVGGVSEIWPPATLELLLPAQAGPAEFAQIIARFSSLPEATFLERREAFRTTAKANTAEHMIDACEHFAQACIARKQSGSTGTPV